MKSKQTQNPCHARSILSSAHGFTVSELVVVMGMGAIMMGMAVSNLKVLENSYTNSLNQAVSIFKLARTRAISTTSAYTVRPQGPFRLVATSGSTCDDLVQVEDSKLQFDFPDTVQMMETAWSVCFSSRGIADNNLVLPIRDETGRERNLQVFLGGASRIEDN